jgi:hypothetical protein
MKITAENLETWKETTASLVNLIPGGAIFATSDREHLTWKEPSASFDIPQFSVGLKLRVGGAAYRCMQSKKEERESIPRSVYGLRAVMTANPVWQGDEVVGSTIAVFPRMNAIAKAFPDFAPMMVDMFPEGCAMFASDLENGFTAATPKVQHSRHNSRKSGKRRLADQRSHNQQKTRYPGAACQCVWHAGTGFMLPAL